ncbi:MAG: helix-turn-helix domain-containing protein, partial [Desulfobacterales bacterium]|nr:helix-turn-helix domain-containing protein [Desulfobacterales bacterium]
HPHDVVDVKDLPQKYISDDCDLSSYPAIPEADDNLVESISLHHLPDGGIDMKQYLTDIEISLIEQALNETNNVVARAANLLHMRRTTLVEKMRKYEIVR